MLKYDLAFVCLCDLNLMVRKLKTLRVSTWKFETAQSRRDATERPPRGLRSPSNYQVSHC